MHTDMRGTGRGPQASNESRRRIIDVLTGFHTHSCLSPAVFEASLQARATTARVAGMIDRRDWDIETGTSGAGRQRQRGDEGHGERAVPYPSRPRPALDLGGGSGIGRRNSDGWQC
jgi:hypothetical protein